MSEKTVSRRDFFKISAAIAGGTILAACAPVPQNLENNEKPAQVDALGILLETDRQLEKSMVNSELKDPLAVQDRWIRNAKPAENLNIGLLVEEMGRSGVPQFEQTASTLRNAGNVKVVKDSFSSPATEEGKKWLTDPEESETTYGSYRYDDVNNQHYIFINDDKLRPDAADGLKTDTAVAIVLVHEERHALWHALAVDNWNKAVAAGQTVQTREEFLRTMRTSETLTEAYAYWEEARLAQLFMDTPYFSLVPRSFDAIIPTYQELAKKRKEVVEKSDRDNSIPIWRDPSWTTTVNNILYQR